ncbi:CocE/NonD family hydrolase [Amycolatopsis pithecellobii]|uniref:CocE/NonD family hydrolase n=1 Tax=Amycolatopsis pithecellobii TaxID=664692 RepID=UPI001AA0144A|nr:CocE/NonD family hydrolase [Amycolatopsis pithecellobii]
MTDTDVIWSAANPPESPTAKWRGFKPGSEVLPQGSVHSPGGLPLPCDIVFERDVEVTLRDGKRIFVDVFRPVTGDPVPALMAWSPYGKQGGYWHLDGYPGRAGVPASAISGLNKWEGPDPAYWCAHGYAIVHPDPRGAFESEGDIQTFSPQEGRDGADVIEWIAEQPWSNQKVGMAGNSWLAISQWIIAAEQPPHLSAIAPWEGLLDIYRDLVAPGGIPFTDFMALILSHHYGRNRYEDTLAMLEAHPQLDEYWATKVFDTSRITVPAYVVASYTNLIHVDGTFRAWERLGSAEKWLRIHNTMEWPDFYEHQDDLRRFYDHVLKGEANGWDETPRVRMAILDPGHDDVVDQPETEFPPSRTVTTKLYLDAASGTITSGSPRQESHISYDAPTGSAVFTGDLGDLTVAGPMRLRLWVESDGHPEVDLFVAISKIDAEGEHRVPEWATGLPSPGARGWMRTSHRALDPELSTDLRPVQSHQVRQPLAPGEVVPVDIAIWPMAMRWHAGEKVRIEVTGHDLAVAVPDLPNRSGDNAGHHTLRTGGRYESYLLAPVLPECGQ